jgi:hypothetical protein
VSLDGNLSDVARRLGEAAYDVDVGLDHVWGPATG